MRMATSRTTPPRRPASPPPNPRRRWRWIAVGLAAALIAVASGFVYLTRGPSKVTVDQAVQTYRDQEAKATTHAPPATAPKAVTSASGAARSVAPAGARTKPQAATTRTPTAFAFPAPGVYTFETSGHEETNALGGQRHDYPKETTMTIRRDGCGWVSHWQPLAERWEESEICEHATGSEMEHYTMYHEFFRRGQKEVFACPGGFVQRVNAKPGDRWTFDCVSDQSKAVSRTSFVSIDTVVVGGHSVRAVHMRYEITASGADSGTLIQDRWISLGAQRVMVRMLQKANLTTKSPFGPVGYKEEFRLDLKSLQPRT
jgi:hypothetical protein